MSTVLNDVQLPINFLGGENPTPRMYMFDIIYTANEMDKDFLKKVLKYAKEQVELGNYSYNDGLYEVKNGT